VTNPFEDPEAQYRVLINDEDQYSLWPAFADIPAGWTVAQDLAGRADSIAFVEANWTDMRPRSLAEQMARD
jgi:MbtH protein